MYDDILFPTDGSEPSVAAFEYAVDLAGTYGATLHVLYVADTNRDSVTTIGGEVVDALESEGDRVVADVEDRAREHGVEMVTEVLQGDPSATILDYADEFGVDCIVMATRGRSGVTDLLLGSTTERVVRQSSMPVLAVSDEE
ncbi:universal stress protein [Haloarchaeobius iranensis]|uniref:Nucleotide-binding universal stress protein, UspA family n=1 Tax=Haloarchaeobius iranensis TaxID=996166 RepID=A0A1G9ZXF7_9EURY|nr:universal stress protein [Haloarchaeobius iranensis]SDN25948.1 Nucleotide-binding universal stress protein, UspA family [Haloarchaeobius iranensis]